MSESLTLLTPFNRGAHSRGIVYRLYGVRLYSAVKMYSVCRCTAVEPCIAMQWERDHAWCMYGAVYSGIHRVSTADSTSTLQSERGRVAAPSLTLSKQHQIDAVEAAHQAGVDERIIYPLEATIQ